MSAAAIVRPERKISVLIAADHAATRTGVKLALAGAATCLEAGDSAAAVDAALRDQPDVCVIDFDPAQLSIRTAAEITAKTRATVVVVMTRRVNAEDCMAAVRAGATGYVAEGIDPGRFPYMIRGLLRGEVAIPRRLVGRLVDELRGRQGRRHLALDEQRPVALTSREWDVVDGLRQGMSTREIADLLDLSDVTVRRHIGAVRQKLGVRSRAELLPLLGDAGG